MQNQENLYNESEQAETNERTINVDPREQAQQQEYTYRPYEDGYSGLNARDVWSEGEKLRIEPRSQKSISGLLLLIALLCAVFIAGGLFSGILSWLSWVVVIVLIIAGISAFATNWRVVTIPMPERRFQVTEHARLTLKNGAGKVAIRRGDQNVISVVATKRASGFGIDPEKMQVNYDQRGDALHISTQVAWNILQFGLRSVYFEITVPANCDVQLDNGSGSVIIQGTSGDIRLRTGSGGIEASELQGQIAMKTGSGGIKLNSLQGEILVQTGSGGITGSSLRGQISLTTGSGGITTNQSMLAGSSRITTGSGGIKFEGALDPRGNSIIKTGSGSILLWLPASAAFSLDAKTGSGGVANEFGSKEVGSGPRAQLKLRTGSGRIQIANTGIYQGPFPTT